MIANLSDRVGKDAYPDLLLADEVENQGHAYWAWELWARWLTDRLGRADLFQVTGVRSSQYSRAGSSSGLS